jgi:hypothetical protein
VHSTHGVRLRVNIENIASDLESKQYRVPPISMFE